MSADNRKKLKLRIERQHQIVSCGKSVAEHFLRGSSELSFGVRSCTAAARLELTYPEHRIIGTLKTGACDEIFERMSNSLMTLIEH